MGKRRSSKDSYKSLGMFKNVSRKTVKLMRRSRTSGERLDNQWAAFIKGKRVRLTVKNPNKNETNKPFIKIDPIHYGWKMPTYKPMAKVASEN